MSIAVQRLGPGDLRLMRALNVLFAAAFSEPEVYSAAPPNDAYLRRALSDEHVIALVALSEEEVVGGLVAYVLDKLEQERREIYVYDLAVAEQRRREGIGTALLREVQGVAGGIGAWVVYVQADLGDAPAVALYESLGTREEVLHFDIPPRAIR